MYVLMAIEKQYYFFTDHNQSNELDIDRKLDTNYHFCEKFTYDNKVCDVNYYIQDHY